MTYPTNEYGVAQHFAIPLEEAREALEDFESFVELREEAILAASDALKPIVWVDCERFTLAENDFAEANRMTLGSARIALGARELDRLASEHDGIDP